MSTPAAIYRTSIAHVRRTPLHNAFTYRSYSWYVDVDVDRLPALPRFLRPLAGFSAADHLGDPAGTLLGNVERFLATRGIAPDGGRITMLASARVFGQVFNPLSLFWCHDAAGELRCVVAEVHNTYGERHCYLLLATRSSYTWVHKYIFPGGVIPSVRAIEDITAQQAGLRVRERLALGEHYAQTLRLWEERFMGRTDEVRAQGFDGIFQRMWLFYLCYSRAGFQSGYLDVQQIVLDSRAA